MPEKGSGVGKGWLRASGLLLATGVLSILNPGILVAIPFGMMAVFLPPRRALPLALGALGWVLAMGGDPESGLWFLERGWALILGGWFLALTLRWPGAGFIPRALGAVLGTFAVMGAHFGSRRGEWAVVDWAVTHRMQEGIALALQALRVGLGPEAVSPETELRALEAVSLQGVVFPALLGLASLSALGFAWWLHGRLARGSRMGIGPLREFRFNDQLVWVLILGLLVLLGSSGTLERIGTNAVVFMGGLYALRGVAVILFFLGGVSFLGWLLAVVAFFFVAPLFIAGAFVVGLGDTWLNLRARKRASSPS